MFCLLHAISLILAILILVSLVQTKLLQMKHNEITINQTKRDHNFGDAPMGPTWGQHWAHLGPVGPRWAPCWAHEPCYQGIIPIWLTKQAHAQGFILPSLDLRISSQRIMSALLSLVPGGFLKQTANPPISSYSEHSSRAPNAVEIRTYICF